MCDQIVDNKLLNGDFSAMCSVCSASIEAAEAASLWRNASSSAGVRLNDRGPSASLPGPLDKFKFLVTYLSSMKELISLARQA